MALIGDFFVSALDQCPNFARIAGLINGLIVLSLTAYIVNQTWLHPLAKYPGPFVAKLTRLYSVYHAFKGSRHSDLYELHQKHGPIVRYGPNHISIIDTEALEQIYGHKSNVKKSSYYRAFTSVSIFNVIDKKAHTRKKRVMAQAFSDQAVRGMEPHILSAIREWCNALGEDNDQSDTPPKSVKDWSNPKDMVNWSAYMIFDVLGEICFGKTFGSSVKDDNRFFLDLMTLTVRIINVCGQMPILQRLGLDTYLKRGTAASTKRQIDFSRMQLKTRLAVDMETTKRRDIIYYLQKAKDPETGEGYSTGELVSECILLLGAGSDTANTALTATFYFLVQHPDILARLSAEIRNNFPNVESIASGPLLQNMTYLRACLDESMRLCPPVAMELPREVLPGGLSVTDHFFPAGTVIGMPIYSLHHSEAHFDRPFTYDPSRWLLSDSPAAKDGEGVSSEVIARQKKAFVPFSVGPRSCIGRNVALLELEVGIARVLWLYDIRMAPGTEHLGVGREGEYKMKDNFIIGKEGPVLQFRKRVDS